MSRRTTCTAVALVLGAATLAHAGGSNYGITIGPRPDIPGRVSEWKVPTPDTRFDPVARKVVKEYRMPAGPDGAPYAVNVDGAGIVCANEIRTDSHNGHLGVTE